MWVLKFQLDREKSIFSPLTKKHHISAIAYPINSFKKDGKYYFTAAGTAFGEKKNVERYLAELKKDPRVKKVEMRKDFFIVFYERDIELSVLYSPELIRIKPVIITDYGAQIWEIGCWEKEPLMDIIRFFKEKKLKMKIFKFKNEDIENLAIVNPIPNITENQKKALQLAVDKGYYEYPRKIELKELAKAMKISYSTYQAHLRKAEKRLMPYMSKNI